MRVIATCALLVAPVCVVVLPGCESSQSKSKRLAAQGRKALHETGLQVRRANPDVRPTDTKVLASKEGAAVAVVLQNASATGQLKVPVSIDVLGRNGKSVFKNDQPGLETALVSAPVVAPHGHFIWVNDQVAASGTPRSVKVRVGVGGTLRGKLPQIGVSSPTLSVDPVSGVEASGRLSNLSSVEQRELVVYGVARRGGHIVAAGRGQIPRLKAGAKKVPYHLFFIGDPRGARLTVEAPPTMVQ
jgi:hypothetical protein